MSFLSLLFANKLVVDEREPVYEIKLPWLEGRFEVLAPNLSFWIQLIALLLLQVVLQSAFAIVVYQWIVKKRNSATSFLLGYGMIIPLALSIPYYLLEILDVRNKTVRLALSTFPTVVFFRTIEAMHNTSPPVVETTLFTYVQYYSSLFHYVWNPKTKRPDPISLSDITTTFFRIILYFHLLSLVLSFLMYYDFQPFPSNVVLDRFHLTFDIFHPGHLANNYLLGVLTYLVLHSSFMISAFSENVKGLATLPIFRNPLFLSKSPSEFWGKRWNLTIHRILKGGAYLPARKYFSLSVAILVTFLASGLLHDYSWSLIFYQSTKQQRDAAANANADDQEYIFRPIGLKLTAFFLWNGAVMLLEGPVGSVPAVQWLSHRLPVAIVSTLVLLTALPVSHWYTGDWARGGFFSDFAHGLWHIRRLP